jgi:hypothetical protein
MLVFCGCAPKLISRYDEQTDQTVTALQKKVDGFLIKLHGLEGTPACAYPRYRGFYEDVKVDVSAIEVRAAAIPQNSATVKQLGLLSKSLEALETLHKLKSKLGKQRNCLTEDELKPLRRNFNTSFTAILKLEIAKKR